MNSTEFGRKLTELLNDSAVRERWLSYSNFNKFSRCYDQAIIEFIDLRPGDVARQRQSGQSSADAMNRRFMIEVTGFACEEFGEPPTGRVKVRQLASSPQFDRRGLKLRGKSGRPEAMAEYVAAFLRQLPSERDPNPWSHFARPCP